MKFLVLFLFVGVATASLYDALDEATDEVVLKFMLGMEQAPSLKSVLDLAESDAVDKAEDHIKTELGRHLKETLEKLLNKIKEAIEHGKAVREEIFSKLKGIREKLKELKLDVGGKAKELLNKIRSKIQEILKKLVEKLEVSKRSVDRADVAFTEMSFREMLKELKKHLLEKVDAEYLREKILKIFGQGTELVEQLLKTLKEKGREKLRMLIDHLLGDDEDKRSLSELWEKVKDYFKDLQIDLKEKFFKFGEWLKEVIDKGITNSKDKLENIKVLAKQFLKHAKGISSEIATEAQEFFRQYKDELGDLWEEIKETVKDAIDKKKEE